MVLKKRFVQVGKAQQAIYDLTQTGQITCTLEDRPGNSSGYNFHRCCMRLATLQTDYAIVL